MTYNGLPLNGGLDTPTGTGAQHIVESLKAIADFLADVTTPFILLDATAGALSLDWHARQAYDDNETVALDWDARQVTDATGGLSINWQSRVMVDGMGQPTVEYGDYLLIDGGGQTSVNWGNRVLVNDSAHATVNWNDCFLHDSAQLTSLDWNGRQAIHSSGDPTVDWEACTLNMPGGSAIVSFNTGLSFFGGAQVSRQAGGALTAGATYNTTAQNMINAMWTALRAYNLLS